MGSSIALFRLVVCSFAIAVLSESTTFSQTTVPASAIEGWHEMAKAVETLQFTIRYSDKKEKISNEYFCSIQGSMEKCEFLISDQLGRSEQVAIQNGRGFRLSRSGNGKWQLSRIHSPGDRIGQLQNAVALAKRGFSLHGGATLLDILGNQGFNVLSWRELSDGSGNVEMKVRFNSNKSAGTLVLQPDKRFRVLSVSLLDDGDANPSVYVNEYKDDSLLTEVVPARHYFKEYEREWELVSIFDRTLPSSEFSLSHYGLPDYHEPSRRTNWWLWGFLVSIILTLGVFWKTRGR